MHRIVSKCPECGKKPKTGGQAASGMFQVGCCRQWFGRVSPTQAWCEWNEWAIRKTTEKIKAQADYMPL